MSNFRGHIRSSLLIMCGIAAWLLGSGISTEEVQHVLKRRGPNACSSVQVRDEGAHMIGCVLHIQGDEIRQQPVVDSDGNALLWNGEVFGGLEFVGSDTLCISGEFQRLFSTCGVGDRSVDVDIIALMSAITVMLSVIHGPYAFIFYAKSLDMLFFGRDPFGRRSLLLGKHSASGEVTGIISVAPSMWLPGVAESKSETGAEGSSSSCRLEYEEVNIQGIYCLRLPQGPDEQQTVLRHAWPSSRVKLQRQLVSRPHACVDGTGPELESSQQFLAVLKQSVRCRLEKLAMGAPVPGSNNVFSVGVLFSGGIDSVILAVLLHLCVEEIEQRMETQGTSCRFAIDLLNVSFYTKQAAAVAPSPDRIAAVVAYGELRTLHPGREWRLVHVDVSDSERLECTPHIRQVIQPSDTHMDLNIGTAFWFASQGRGTLRTCDYTEDEISALMNSKDASGRPLLRVGEEDAALSVGLTSWSQQHLKGSGVKKPPTKKINREKKHSERDGVEVDCDDGAYVTCPQEKCGRIAKPKCIHGMCKRCCLKLQKQQLGEKVERAACKVHKCSFGVLPAPTSSVSINCEGGVGELPPPDPAAGGAGSSKAVPPMDVAVAVKATPEPQSEPYTSSAKVLLIGIGADEQMAGYGRHRTAFVRGAHVSAIDGEKETDAAGGVAVDAEEVQYAELTRELNKDQVRLWERNLGRDDRCIADHGRESWSPYLDENVVQFLQNLHLSQICSLDLPPGEGDKKILRDVAKVLGLVNTSAFVKRAIQFGTRIAKQMNLEVHGSNRKGSGLTTL